MSQGQMLFDFFAAHTEAPRTLEDFMADWNARAHADNPAFVSCRLTPFRAGCIMASLAAFGMGAES
jgi:hypothetical protein